MPEKAYAIVASEAKNTMNQPSFFVVGDSISCYDGRYLETFGKGWFDGGKPTHAKDPLLLMVLCLFRDRVKRSLKLSGVIRKAVTSQERQLRASLAAVRKHGASGWAIAVTTRPRELFESLTLAKYYATDGLTGMSLASREDHDALFPLGSMRHNTDR